MYVPTADDGARFHIRIRTKIWFVLHVSLRCVPMMYDYDPFLIALPILQVAPELIHVSIS